jgi:hypothetical protein
MQHTNKRLDIVTETIQQPMKIITSPSIFVKDSSISREEHDQFRVAGQWKNQDNMIFQEHIRYTAINPQETEYKTSGKQQNSTIWWPDQPRSLLMSRLARRRDIVDESWHAQWITFFKMSFTQRFV